MNNKILKIKDYNGKDIEIEVLDIIENINENRNYMIYRLLNQKDVFASILNEKENTYSLDTIEDEREFKYLESYLAHKAKERLGDRSL